MRLARLQNLPPFCTCRESRYAKVMAQSVSNTPGKKLVRIDVSSDTVCPWCFVGKRNLDKAIAASKDQFDFEIRWHPFFLDSSAPKEGVNKREFYEKKFGSRFTGMMARMTEVFRGLGLEYDMSGLTEFLVESARKVGIEGAAEFLEDPNNGVKEVNEELEKYSSHITGVPYYVINGNHKFSGGQPPEVFQRAFQVDAN
ncbi:uncharacterized protein LOC110820257 isoform X3 [Carica papaya]|uniref:uncharacterized protein LOC110820257 isoform X3 n=1 Tax=Carica papaya TaxID=3649 RepID=UPI000B8C9B05|nr:uncharacterized protein LOC110820257 isoform X3 [Carica papaya]